MKKTLLLLFACLIACVSATTLSAQTNVTSVVLQNAGFDQSINHSASETSVNVAVDAPAPGTFEAVAGWTVVPSFIGNSASSSFAFGSPSKVNNTVPPTVDKDGNSAGGVLGFSVAWLGFVTYYQAAYLPAGDYTIEAAAYNNGPAELAHSRVGWVPESGASTLSTKTSYTKTTWITETVNFILTADTKGKIQIGVASTNTGSGAHGRIFFDNIKLTCNSFTNNVASKISDATTLVGSDTDTAAAALNSAITSAQTVANAGSSATFEEVFGALSALDNAMNIYRIAVASPEKMVDMTSRIKNASFEHLQIDKQQTIPYWTKTGTANNEYCTRTDAGPLTGTFKHGNVYFQYWSNANPKPDFSIYQNLTALPNGKYRLTVAAGGDAGTTGTYVYAGDNQTEVTSTGEHSVDAVVVNGTLTIGFKSVSRTVNWAYADNFRLYYLGEVHEPTLTVSAVNLFLSENLTSKTFTVIGTNLTDDIAITASAGSGLTVSQATIAKNAVGLATGITVTATYNPAAVTGATVDGAVSVVSGGITKTIAVKSFKNPTPANLLGLALGNGHTGAGSEPNTFGWNSTNAGIVWSATTGDNYAYRFRDGLHADVPRILSHPVDNAIFSFPVALEAGKSYLFSCKNSNFNNPGSVEATFSINSTNDGTGTTLASQTALSGKWDSSTAEFKFGMDVVSTGGYYLLWQTTNGHDRNFIWALNLQEAYKVSFNSNGGSAVDAQYAISGGTVAEPAAPTKDETSFLGWYADTALTTAWDFASAITANTTLYAKWDTSTGISIVNDELISTEYFTLQGQRLGRPSHNGVYLIKRTYASRKTEIEKVVYKKD